MSDELLNDELPSPPPESVGGSAEGESTPIADTIDASLFQDVPKMGEAMPVGTYIFRLDSYTEHWTSEDYKTGRKLEESEKQPYFSLQWKCQQEPHVGRVVFENVPWVKPEDVRDAANPASPRRAEARKILNDRLPRAKEIMQEAGFTPSGQMKFKDFLGTNPEMKIVVKIREVKRKNQAGQLQGTGEWRNEVGKHISLHRPM